MSTPQPIKRSPELAPLSREHHEGLLFVWKIRQGLKKNIAPARIGAFVHWFWEHHLQPHFAAEENVLAARMPADDSLVQRMMDEHMSIEALLHINASITDAALLEELANLVNDHIRFEERELFPHAERLLSAEALTQIRQSLEKEKNRCGNWGDAFWEKDQ